MKKFLLGVGALLFSVMVLAQDGDDAPADTSWKKQYRESYTRINDLVHTKLDIRFDYAKTYAYGKVWLTLQPHFYATDSLLLDAKGMDIAKVALSEGSSLKELKYSYDGMFLNIRLNKAYKGGEKYTVYIEYTAKPNEYKAKGSMAITDAKGLYFINPKGEEKDKATQIWTQGETEGTSVWVPIIDKPNQKTTNEITMTVPDKYVTLSNGKLVGQKKNADGTRTDSWKMDQPHSPYLFFMGVGDYAVIKDSYKGKEVSYYVEKEYASVARKIFGHTPEMIAYFSRITGVDYPWVKYAQITGQDYVSGAMENTTATLHSSAAQQDARELVDGNAWESTVAHELFHQWFGDYVTTESWSNLTLNESFANYSEVLWDEYKYGKDAGDAQNYNDMQGYLQSGSEKKDLVRFFYADREDMFDAVSYNKGGRILHMLRNYLGDSAFFKGLNLYLTTNKYKSAEAHQLRLAFEEVSGRDLNWYFNQWYFSNGHPKLSIDYIYDDAAKNVKVVVKQTQAGDKVFRLPLAIDIYNGAKKERKQVWVETKADTFSFAYSSRPDLVNVDAEKILLAEKKDNKTLDNYIHQYTYAGKYVDRREAIEFASKKQDDPKAQALLKTALKDPYKGLRNLTLQRLNMRNETVKKDVEPILAELAAKDKDPNVRAAALGLLANYKKPEYNAIFAKAVSDSSYTIAGTALEALAKADEAAAFTEVKKLNGQVKKGKLLEAALQLMIKSGDVSVYDEILSTYSNMGLSQEKFNLTQPICDLIAKTNDTEKVKRGVDAIVKFRDGIPEQYGITPVINNFLNGIVRKKETAKATMENKTAIQEQIDYIKSKVEKERKGF